MPLDCYKCSIISCITVLIIFCHVFFFSTDHSTSSGTSTFKPVNPLVSVPASHVMPRSSLTRHREDRLETSCWDSNYSLSGTGRTYGHSDSQLDMKDSGPMKKWSSLSKLSTPDTFGQDGKVENTGLRHSLDRLGRDGSLSQNSRGYRPSCLHYSMEALRLYDKDVEKKDMSGMDLKYKFDSCSNTELSPYANPSRRHTLDMTYSALPESKPFPTSESVPKFNHLGYQAGSPLQSSLRTQMWLTDQLHANSPDRRTPEDTCGLSAWHPLEHLRQDPEQSQVLVICVFV